MKRKNVLMALVIIMISWLSPSCQIVQEILASYLYGGYNYNITTQADWYDPNLNYYGDYYVRNPNYYTGYVHTPLPGGFTPRSYRYNWSGNTCTMDLYDDYRQTGNSCQRRFQYKNNQFYWLR